MAHQHLDVVLDASTTLQSDPTTYSTSGNGAVIVDLGPGARELDVVFNWSACVSTAGNAMTFRIEGSNVADMGSGVHVLGTLALGVSTVTLNAVSTPPNGQTILRCHNIVLPSATDSAQQSPVRYIRLARTVTGSGSVTIQRCGITYTRK